MHVSIIPKIEQLVRRKAESGLYRDPSGLIREALRLMAAQNELAQLKLERPRAPLIASEGSGLAEDFSMDQMMAQLDEDARAEPLRDC